MTDDDVLRALLQSALPAERRAPARDLWPGVVRRLDAPIRWSPVDISLAAIVAVALLLFPEGVWLMAFHL
jgi:hypothetical protein